MRILIRLAAAAALFAASAQAEEADAASIFNRLEGEWVSDGDAFGAPSRTIMVWGFALGGKFASLEYRIEMSPNGRPPAVFEGVAFYEAKTDDAVRAFWADNGGELHPIAASVEQNALISLWGVDGAKQGRTRYEFADGEVIVVTDWIKTEEGWKQFNQNRFRRAAGAAE